MTAIDDRPVLAAVELRRQQTIRAHEVLGQLMQRIPLDIPMWRWSICSSISETAIAVLGVEGSLGVMPNGHASRAAVMAMAEQFGLNYIEKPHLDGKNIVLARGVYSEVQVKFYDLVDPCGCGNCGGAR